MQAIINSAKTKKSKDIHKPHDHYFRKSLSNKEIAKDFLETHLPKEILKLVDLNSLELYSNSFVDQNLKEKITDLIYKVKIQEEYGYITCLIEHQSSDDPLMAFRLLKYQVLIMEQHLLQQKLNNQKLPIIVSLLFYHGEKTPYPYSRDLFDLFNNKQLAKKIFCKPFNLVDLTIISDEQIKTHKLNSLLELAQKHIRDRDFLINLKMLVEVINNILNNSQNNYWLVEYVENTLYYIINVANIDNKNLFFKELTRSSKILEQTGMATVAQQLRQEGMQEGMQQGIKQGYEEVIIKLLLSGCNIDLIMQATGFTKEQLEELVKK